MRFTAGERVSVSLSAGGRTVAREGTVKQESKTGVEVCVEGEYLWVTSNRVRRILPNGETVRAVHRKSGRASTQAPDTVREVEVAAPPVLAPVRPVVDRTATPDDLFAQLRAAGLDPMDLWDRLGSAIAGKAREELTAANEGLTRALDDLLAAEMLVRDAEAGRGAAEKALAAAVDDVALAAQERDAADAALRAARARVEHAEGRMLRVGSTRP